MSTLKDDANSSRNRSGWGTTIAVFIGLSIGGTIGGELGKEVTSKFIDSDRPSSLDAALKEGARAVNRKAPMRVDAATRLDGAHAGPGKRFRYDYTILGAQGASLNSTHLSSLIATTVRDGFCSHASMKYMRSNGVTVTYQYFDESRRRIGAISVSPRECT